MTVNPFPIVEMAVKELIESAYDPADGKVGGDMAYQPGDDLYVWINLLPGGSATEIDGEWIIDVDCFGPSYGGTMTHALALEALLIGARKVTSVMRIDNVYENEGPAQRPWDDDAIHRIGATYVLTARRSG